MDKHDTLLVSCASALDRGQLRDVLGERYHLLEAQNVQQTLLLLNQNRACIAAILLDISGLEALDLEQWKDPQVPQLLEALPVILFTREDSPELRSKGLDYGAADVIPLDYEPYAMLHRIRNIVELHLYKQHLNALVAEQAEQLRQSNESMVDVLSSIIEYRSVESGQHILRIRHFTKILLEEVAASCPEYGLTEQAVAIISSASALHDIGKIAIPDSVLMKPGRLDDTEMAIMRSHALTGSKILEALGNVGDPEYLRYAHNICRCHHERWDGCGYPQGLAGDAIPICAQVVGLADAYDALTTKRVYKDAYPMDTAVNMILQGECGVFSPKLLECFKRVANRFEALARAYADGLAPQTEHFEPVLPLRLPGDSGMDHTQAKYFSLVHYLNAFVMEMSVSKGRFHLVYNPYPELSAFQQVHTVEEMKALVLEELVHPDQRQEMDAFVHQAIPAFLRQDLRRYTRQFRLQRPTDPQGDLFEVTLLRNTLSETETRPMTVLIRKLEVPQPKKDTVVYTLAESTCCCRYDRDFTLVDVGRETTAIGGYSIRQIREQLGGRLMELVCPEDRERVRREFRSQLQTGTGVQVEYRIRCKDGSVHWVMNKSRLVADNDGQEYLYTFLTDTTQIHTTCDALQAELDRCAIILAQTENVLFDWNLEEDTILFSDTWEAIFGFPPVDGNVRGALASGSYFHPDDLPLLTDRISALEEGSNYELVEVRMATDKGRYLWCRFRASAVRDDQGRLKKIVGVILNIDAEKQAQRLLQDRAERDALTKLLNKNTARKQAEEYLSLFAGGAPCAMLIIDLDNFKQVNDQYGHLFGDAVLTKVATEIQRLFRSQDIVARIGGDEFMVLMRGVNDRRLVESRCQRLLNIFEGTFRGRQYNLPLGCSIGISLSPEHGISYYDLFNRADQALYRVKARGKNSYAIYESAQPAIAKPGRTAINNQIDSDVDPQLSAGNIVQYAFQRLYAARDVVEAVNEILAIIGQQMNVSRVYVFENSEDNRFCSNTYEWCNTGIPPEIEHLQKISYETDIPHYEENFNEQGIFYCPDVRALPQQVYNIVASQGILSMLQCAIREGGVFRGYIGFDECVERRMWTKEQIDTLAYFSEMLSVFLLKRREQERAVRQAADFRAILDDQNFWLYIVDPQTWVLKYANKKVMALSPEVRPGNVCHRAIMGRDVPCPGCPAVGILETRNANALLRDGVTGEPILAEASMVPWEGEESCLMTSRRLPK